MRLGEYAKETGHAEPEPRDSYGQISTTADLFEDQCQQLESIHARLNEVASRLLGSVPRGMEAGEPVNEKLSATRPPELQRLTRVSSDIDVEISRLLSVCERLEEL